MFSLVYQLTFESIVHSVSLKQLFHMGSRTLYSPGLPPNFLATSTSFLLVLFHFPAQKCWRNSVYFLDLLSRLYSLDGLTQSYGFKYHIYADDSKYISQHPLFSKLCPWILVLYTQLSTWYFYLAELLIALALLCFACDDTFCLEFVASI